MENQPGSSWMPLDFLLLAVLIGIYFGMRSAIPLPQVIGVDQNLTALAVLLVMLYWFVGYRMAGSSIPHGRLWLLKYLIIFCLIGLVVLAPTVVAAQWRAAGASHEFVHDGLIQSEIAAQYALAGLNPYHESYSGTVMADWPFRVGDITNNPALEHYPYLPLTFLIPLPMMWMAGGAAESLDHRFIYLGMYFGVLIMTLLLVQPNLLKATFLMSVGLNPTLLPFLIEGRNDILPLFFIMLSLLLLSRKRILASAIVLAFACATKQFAWVFIPFYFAYISQGEGWWARIESIKKPLLLFVLVLAIIILPWLVQNPRDFIEDTLLFQAGLGEGAYPITGFGLSALVLSLGWVQSPDASAPLWIIPIVIGIPILVLSVRRILRRPVLGFAVGSYALLLGLLLFSSRAFNDNYVGYLTSLFILAAFLQMNDEATAQRWAQ